MNSVAPVWDGNETWLVLGGGGLMAAFPLAYAVLMPALYTPIIAMLLGLVFRGVAFEFRWRTARERNRWDIAFCRRLAGRDAGAGHRARRLLQGIHVEGRAYAGGWWDWLTPFSMLTGVALVIGYALLGATWLVMKTEGELRDAAYRLSWLAAARDARRHRRRQRRDAVPDATTTRSAGSPGRTSLATAPVPLAVAVVTALLLRSLAQQAATTSRSS